MEPSVEALFPLPRRRSHIPSRTYRSLVRICSGFSGESCISLATPTVLQELLLRSDDNAKDEAAQVSLEETCEPGEICTPPCHTEPENSSVLESITHQNESAAPTQCCKDVGLDEPRIVLDDTNNLMMNKTDGIYQENSLMFDFQDGMDGQSQITMDELEFILNEDNDLLPEDCMNFLETLDVSDVDSSMIASLSNKPEESLDPKQVVVEKPGFNNELQGNRIKGDNKISESVDLPLEDSMAKESRSHGVSVNYNETQSTAMELEKPASSSRGFGNCNTQMVEDEDIEEGEISGDVYINYDDMVLVDDVPMETMNGKDVTEEVTNNEGTMNSENFSCNSSHAVISPPEIGKGQMECGDKLDTEVDNLDERMIEDENVESKASGSHGTSCNEKLNDGSGKKNKSTRSKKSKADRKANYRKKRAENRRLLGVKRLKLKPVAAKPKPVNYCRQYLKGRCQEGENCKYSHDVIPLTKSSPCCYFATRSCMKGNDCPFDHDLSKYPCNNFTTNGFCHRGDDCLFSHKSSSTPGTALDVSKSEPNTNVAAAASSFSFRVSSQKTTNKRNATDVPLMKASSQSYRGTSSLKMNEDEKFQTPIRKPSMSVVPKGISFLSLTKTSSEKNNNSKMAQQEQSSSSPSIQNLLKVPFQNTTPQTTPNTIFQMHQTHPSPIANAPYEQRPLGTVQTTSQPSTSSQVKVKATTVPQTQMTLLSALKLAADFESVNKTKKSTTVPTAVNKLETDSMNGGATNSRNTSSKILEFLASFSRTGNNR